MRGHSGCGCCCVNRAAESDWAASFSFPPLARGVGAQSPYPLHRGGLGTCLRGCPEQPSHHCQCCPNICTWFCSQDGSHIVVASDTALCLDSARGPVLIQEVLTGAPVTASHSGGLQPQSSPEYALTPVHLGRHQAQQCPVHTHPQPHFPDFIQWHVHSGDGGRHKVGPDLSWSPGGTTHHALQMGGGTGGLGGPSRSLCTREEAVSAWVPLAQAHNGRG